MSAIYPPSSTHSLFCHQLISKLARHSTTLPNSLFLKDVHVIPNPAPQDHTGDIYDMNQLEDDILGPSSGHVHPYPVACGGFADIYLGRTNAKQLVAIKVLQLFPSDERRRKVFSVRVMPLY